jgi:hypothetical protein
MARRFLLLSLVCFSTLTMLGSYSPPTTECPSKDVKAKLKKQLSPYKYDSSNTTRFTFKNKAQKKEVEVPLFLTEKYKMVISVAGMPVRPLVRIYNKDHESKSRELLFSSDDHKDKTEFEYETKKWTRKVFVNIEVPAAADSVGTGCVFFVVGYE